MLIFFNLVNFDRIVKSWIENLVFRFIQFICISLLHFEFILIVNFTNLNLIMVFLFRIAIILFHFLNIYFLILNLINIKINFIFIWIHQFIIWCIKSENRIFSSYVKFVCLISFWHSIKVFLFGVVLHHVEVCPFSL